MDLLGGLGITEGHSGHVFQDGHLYGAVTPIQQGHQGPGVHGPIHNWGPDACRQRGWVNKLYLTIVYCKGPLTDSKSGKRYVYSMGCDMTWQCGKIAAVFMILLTIFHLKPQQIQLSVGMLMIPMRVNKNPKRGIILYLVFRIICGF